MKNILLSLFLFGCFSAANHAEAYFFLPEDFSVYTDGEIVINWQPSDSYEKKNLRTFNFYQGSEGGYVAIYTRDADAGVYSVGDGIYVIGQIRVPGHYEGRIFIPKGYELGDDMTQDPELLAICAKYFPDMEGRMWIGGDTGGWFGLY